MLIQVGLVSLRSSRPLSQTGLQPWRLSGIAFLLMFLSACTGGTVVFAPTPLPPDLSPQIYNHPSGAFSLALPRNWSVFAPDSQSLAMASFSLPEQPDPALHISVANTGTPIETQAFADLLNQYQSQIRPDLSTYTEQDRQSMSDGSWRMVGLRRDAAGNTQQINTFFQRYGSLLAITEVVMPPDATQQAALERAVNTFSVNEAANLPIVTLTALAAKSSAQLRVVNLNSWTTAQGVFFITGEIQNNASQDWAAVPVRAAIYAEDGTGLAEARDLVMGHAIPAGGFAPFSLRFGQGQPPDGRLFDVILGDTDLGPAEPGSIVGAPVLAWDDQIESGPEGQRYISGSITNQGDVPLRQARAVVTLFDDQGKIVGARFVDAADALLLPGESSGFSIDVPDLGAVPVSYIVNVQALACTEADAC